MTRYLVSRAMLALMQKMFHVPGVAIGVIRHGKVDLKLTSGYADVEKGEKVTGETVFDIGSCSKSFTSLLAAMAVSEGKLDWDTPVIEYWPEFMLSDPYITRHITARDMACHRSGMTRHDFGFNDAEFDRDEFIWRMQYLSFSSPLRQKVDYQNQIIVMFGTLLEKIYGKSWEELIREKITDPLGMEIFYRGEIVPSLYSKGHLVENGKPTVIPYQVCSADNPCGGIKLSLEDGLKYIQALVDGQFTPLIKELITPQMPVDDSHLMPGEQNYSYGLGWTMINYHGRKIARHAGVVAGFFATIVMVPEETSGFIILSNVINAPLVSIMQYVMTDTVLGITRLNYPGIMKKYYARVEAGAKKNEQQTIKAIENPHDLNSYTGSFFDPGYGEGYIKEEEDALTFTIRKSTTVLKHHTATTFTGTVPVLNAPIMLHFHVDMAGRISSFDLYGFGNEKKLCTMVRKQEKE
jgi:CubicO group peptidase (beta-lactamase class C family)